VNQRHATAALGVETEIGDKEGQQFGLTGHREISGQEQQRAVLRQA